MLEEILSRENMTLAYKRVVSNKGSAGVDGVSVKTLRNLMNTSWAFIKVEILEGNYKPESVKRVVIPKPSGGTRQLGVPTTTDRLIQQAISQVLSKHYDKSFSNTSYGFRPRKNAHQAIEQAQSYLNEGSKRIVDIDLEKFFDTVNHDYLMHLLSQGIEDKRVLKLIRSYLQSGVMQNGLVKPTRSGTPQGGPLSPLLSNILLDKLDKELERRGHKFVRYADDCSIYVKSSRSAERVLSSITKYIEKELKLKVNQQKSGIRTPRQMKLLGYGFYPSKGGYRLRIASQSYDRFKRKVKQLTKKTWSMSMEERLDRLNSVCRGWFNYFKLADSKKHLQRLDEWIRSRLRYCIWKQWKRVRTKYKALVKLGIEKRKAYEWANTRKGGWRIVHSFILTRTITNKRLKEKGYISLMEMYSKQLLT